MPTVVSLYREIQETFPFARVWSLGIMGTAFGQDLLMFNWFGNVLHGFPMCFLFSFLDFHYIRLRSVKGIRYSIISLMVGQRDALSFSQPFLLLMVGVGE